MRKDYLKNIEEIKGYLTQEEWYELVALDYILTFRYTENYDADLKRYEELINKRQNGS